MAPEECFAPLRASLVGRTVTDRQLAGNSLSLWIDKVPGDGATGWTIWLDPAWHVVGPDRVLAGSMQAQDEEEDSGWKAVAAAVDGLIGRTIDELTLEPVTGDITVDLSGGVRVRTFASDPRETSHWRVKDYATGESVHGSSNGTHREAAT
jgi:hypothetical protein